MHTCVLPFLCVYRCAFMSTEVPNQLELEGFLRRWRKIVDRFLPLLLALCPVPGVGCMEPRVGCPWGRPATSQAPAVSDVCGLRGAAQQAPADVPEV